MTAFPSVSDFRRLPWREQNDALEPHVLAALCELKEPVPTMRLVVDVANRIGWLDKDLDLTPGAGQAIGAVLKRFARFKPGWASQTGEKFTMGGKAARRWLWWPQTAFDNSATLRDIFS